MSKSVFEDIFRFSGRRNRKSYALYMVSVACGLIAGLLAWAAIEKAAAVATLTILLLALGISANVVAAQRCRDLVGRVGRF